MREDIKQASDGETANVASYVSSARYEDLPTEVVAKAKLHILDTLGAMISGVQLDVGKLIVEFARREPGKEEATVIGTNLKTSPITASLVNGTLGHADETDDHAGCAALPPALALGERERIDGKTFINAIVLGYDFYARVDLSLNLAEFRKRKHSRPGIATCFGAVASASSILGLGKEQVCSALGLTGQQACSPLAIFYGPLHMAKAFDLGVGVRNGITAALLAQLGFQGAPDIFEGPASILESFSGPNYFRAELTRDLGSYYHIIDTSIKKYPCGGPMQLPLEGLFQIMREQKLQAKDMQEIIVTMPETRTWSVRNNRPIQDINFEYIMTAGAYYGKLGWEDAHSESKWRDPKIQEFTKRVSLVGIESQKPTWAVEVITRGGKRHSITVDAIHLTQAQLEEKFLGLASPVVGFKKAHNVVDTVSELEKVKDIGQLADLLRV